jgi:hypothetical protein
VRITAERTAAVPLLAACHSQPLGYKGKCPVMGCRALPRPSAAGPSSPGRRLLAPRAATCPTLTASAAPPPPTQGKVDMSVAMVPLTEEAGWGPAVQGFVQGIFYTGD